MGIDSFFGGKNKYSEISPIVSCKLINSYKASEAAGLNPP